MGEKARVAVRFVCGICLLIGFVGLIVVLPEGSRDALTARQTVGVVFLILSALFGNVIALILSDSENESEDPEDEPGKTELQEKKQ